MKWKRANYLVHRWSGIVLGLVVAAWFGSGIVMMYYPYPVLTESERDELLEPFVVREPLIGVEAAVRAAVADFAERGHPVAADPERTIVGARLMLWNGRPVYRIRHQRGYRIKPYLLVDARTGEVLSPIAGDEAVQVAARALPAGRAAPVAGVDLLPRGDHYMFWGSYHLEDFPVWRVRFADPARTFVYVGRETGRVYATADRTARVATWIGTVPHWLYFMWLYEHGGLWTWLNLILPGAAVAISLTGIVLGSYQLFPRRRRGEWRVSAYHGVSAWHHVAGVVFGLLVFTWTLSGVFEMLGASNDVRAGQAAAVRGGPLDLGLVRIGAAEAAARSTSSRVLAVDLGQLLGRPGYRVLRADGSERWVDAETGEVRGELTADQAARTARAIMAGSARVVATDRLDAYDTYYYHRHGREMRLPVWRARFDDDARSASYLDVVTGEPVGFVDADTRTWRWLRDGVHSLDFPALVANRPWWDVVVLPLMIGGTLSALTGVWLCVRRLGRMRRRREHLLGQEPAPGDG